MLDPLEFWEDRGKWDLQGVKAPPVLLEVLVPRG